MASFGKLAASGSIKVAGETGFAVGLDIGIQGAIGSSLCNSLGDQNPYIDCMKQCESYDTDYEKKGCIMQMGCLDKDEKGKPLFENKSLKDECLDNVMKNNKAGGQIDYEGLKYSIGKEVAVEIAEEIGMQTLKKKFGNSVAKK